MTLGKKQLSGVLLTLLLFLAGLAIGFIAGQKVEIDNADWRNTSLSDVSKNQVSVMIDYGNQPTKVFHDVEVMEGESLLTAIERYFKDNEIEFVSKEYAGLGVLVEQIGDRKNGDENRYWQYWVNNVMVQIGAQAFYPKPGDIILWKFAPHYEQ